MTNIMEYGAAGLIGCLLFWVTGVAKVETAFSGFANDTPWFLFGAIMLGVAANKTGVPQRGAYQPCVVPLRNNGHGINRDLIEDDHPLV